MLAENFYIPGTEKKTYSAKPIPDDIAKTIWCRNYNFCEREEGEGRSVDKPWLLESSNGEYGFSTEWNLSSKA